MRPLGNSHRRNRGFSLVELMISLLIVSIILVATVSLFIGCWRAFLIGNTYLDVYSNSRLAAEWMARDIRWAEQVVPTYGSYTTSDSCIVLMVPSIDASGDIMASCYDYIIYQLQGNDLHRIVQKDAQSSRQNENRVVAGQCSSLTLSSGGVTLSNIPNLSAVNTIEIFLPLNEQMISLTGGGVKSAQLTPTTVVRLRNK
ncbi:MAG: prepilin-type N-terminal cleavage/methylation domain-containing protein [Candidatus Omnitrophica bacterium]|nr:prepilin-type N-terminal cleavage/methylation domain-containing protein [Candidatus Omnitrophota bacterium]